MGTRFRHTLSLLVTLLTLTLSGGGALAATPARVAATSYCVVYAPPDEVLTSWGVRSTSASKRAGVAGQRAHWAAQPGLTQLRRDLSLPSRPVAPALPHAPRLYLRHCVLRR
jgi:hypothetical protein